MTPATGSGPGSCSELDPAQLLGATIGVTSHRRSDELIATFTRRGADVVHAPTMRIVPITEDAALVADTRAAIADPPDVLVVTTAIGLRGWISAAEAHGLDEALVEALSGAQVLARGPKARGAVRAAGLSEAWTAASEQTAEAVEHLLAQGVRGRSVLVQLHGAAGLEDLEPLRAAGADLRTVAVYRWEPPEDPGAVDRLVDALAARSLDAVTFTSAPGAVALLEAAERRGRLPEVLAAMDGSPRGGSAPVVCCAVGDVTAAPLRERGVEPLVPDRWRLGALMRCLSAHLADHPRARVATPAGELVVRARAAVLDGRVLDLAPGPLALLARLAAEPGRVVGRAELLSELPTATDGHAVEVVVARLRAALPRGAGAEPLVRTVVKRGYALEVA
ncbi:uroporphyrinogen-III synthase [Quadrisphaera setariae]|uniref:Uroporphyrinogen-III synthase n=1 Tax=Quadrisphaera setariae TaxID=2593304 RepID=A0A5C8ZGH4_9ACTN|nr:uroporphyrinogen-III synthase [Quadrisphaera setariae]TXR56654.1 uroporphyrinogen-III synthase [Quadrisphaera setariae]